MDSEKLLRFSVSQEIDFEEIENSQFSKVKMKIYSADRVNAHGYTISLKNLKKYAKSIGGKPIVAYISNITHDATGHEKNEMPMGFVPFDPELSYEKSDDGTIYLCVIGYIWNIYCNQLVEIFKKSDGVKGLSCEMLILDSEIIEDTGVEEILAYSFAGLTILGDFDAKLRPIKPAVEGCDATILENSIIAYEEAKVEFEKILYSAKVKDEEITHSESLININKEDIMENILDVNSSEIVENATEVETLDNAIAEVETTISTETHVHKYGDDGEFLGCEHEHHSITETHIEEISEEKPETDIVTIEVDANATDEQETEEEVETEEKVESEEEDIETNSTEEENKEVVENSEIVQNSVTQEEFDAMVNKCAELEEIINNKNNEIQALTLKCSTLEEYKLNKETESMKKVLNSTLNSVSHILSPDQMSQWHDEAMKCSLDKVDEFTNKLKAFAFDLQEKQGVQQIDSIRNNIANEVEDDSSLSVWDRLDRKYV